MSELTIRQVNCAGCGAKVDIRTGLRMKTFVCQFCGSICENEQVVGLLADEQKRAANAPRGFLRLGLKGRFLGRDYQVVGRMRLQDSDDEETWDWDEWFLMSNTGYPLWLQEDEHGLTLFQVYVPTQFIDPSNIRTGAMIDKVSYLLNERGKARTVFLEGEFTWRARPGEIAHYVDLKKGRKSFSIEYAPQEIQYLRGKLLKAEELVEAFPDVPPEAIGKTKGKASSKPAAAWGVLAFLAILVAVPSLFMWIISDELGNKVLDEQVTLQIDRTVGQDFPLKKLNGDPVTFTLSGGDVTSITFKSSEFGALASGNEYGWWVSADVVPVEDPEHTLATMDTSFWWATGVDEGERWTEKKVKDTHYIRGLKAGTPYTLTLHAASQNRPPRPAKIHLRIIVREKAWHPVPFMIIAIISGVLGIIFLAVKFS